MSSRSLGFRKSAPVPHQVDWSSQHRIGLLGSSAASHAFNYSAFGSASELGANLRHRVIASARSIMLKLTGPRPLSSRGNVGSLSASRSGQRPCQRVSHRVQAFKPTAPIQDWRVSRMVATIEKYFQLWSRGDVLVSASDASLADQIFAADCVHQDVIWGGGRGLVAGQNAMKNFVQSTRSAYPDMMIEAVDFATSDLEHGGKIFCRWQGTATFLGPGVYHGQKPTNHASSLTGVSIFSFEDHKHISKVEVWRTALAEDKHALEETEQDPTGLHELHLHRLL